MTDENESFRIELEPAVEENALPESQAGEQQANRPHRHPRYPDVIVEPPVATEDEEIYCPVCSYNLTGIYSGRCPECGAEFHREALIAAQQANQITLIPWDDPEEMPLKRRLSRTLRICLVSAERFAFAFAVRPRESRVATFFCFTVLAATLIGLLATLAFVSIGRLTSDPYTGLIEPLRNCCRVCAFIPLAIVTSTFFVGLFLWAYCPHYDGLRHFKPWLSIAAYAAAHFLLIAVAIPVYLLLPALIARVAIYEYMTVAFFIWAGCTALCVLTLRAVIWWRTAELKDPTFTVFVIAFLYGLSALACLYLAAPIGDGMAWTIRVFQQ